MPSGLVGSEIAGKTPVYLLDLVIAGRPYYVATEPVAVVDVDGLTREYREGLAVQVAEDRQQATLRLSIDEDWAQLEARGINIERSRATLRRWYTGTLERARGILAGVVVDREYGERDEPMTLTLTTTQSVARELPSGTQKVTAETWPVRGGYAIDEKIEGQWYPQIIGCPGHNDTAGGTPYAAVPVLLVEYASADDTSRAVVANGLIQATRVELWDYTPDEPTNEPRDRSGELFDGEDGAGNAVTLINWSSTGVVAQDVGQQLFVGFQDDADYGGGVYNADRTGPLRGLGEVLLWALRTYTDVPVDVGRMEAQRVDLDAFKVDAYINRPTSMLEWAQSVAEMVPGQWVETSRGRYYRLRRWSATTVDVVAHLDADRNDVARETPMRRYDVEPANRIVVEYKPFQGSRYLAQVVVDAEATSSTLGLVVESFACRVSRDLYADPDNGDDGVREVRVTLPYSWDRGTAVRVGQLIAAERALPKRQVVYSGGIELDALEAGDVVTLTDTAMHLSQHLCLVDDVAVEGDRVRLLLITLDNPLQWTRSTT